MSDFFPLSIEADRVRPITPEYGLLRGECWTTVPLPPSTTSRRTLSSTVGCDPSGDTVSWIARCSFWRGMLGG